MGLSALNMPIPFYDKYRQVTRENEQRGMQELQQAAGAASLMGALQQQEQRAQMQKLLEATNGDVEKAVEVAVRSGNLHAAHELAPLVRLAQERRQADETKKGLAELLSPPGASGGSTRNPMVPGPGASVMAGSGEIVPQAAPPQSPETLKQQRREQLNRMAVLYANNPTVQSRILAEIGDLDKEAKADKENLSPLGKLLAERNKYTPGSKEWQIYDQAITKYQPGGVQVNVAPNAPLIPGKPAQNKVDEGLLDAGMRLQMLSAIEKQFKPEFQQVGTRWDALKLAWRDKTGLDLAKLDQGERQRLTEFSQFKRNSIDALNRYIQSVTGAAMTNQEAERILRGLPNPGTGLFDGDSPTEFKAKMDDAIKQVRMAEARLVYIKRNGLSLGDVSLDRMPSLMNGRGVELEGLIKKQQPNLADADVRKLVKRNLAQEFGLVE